MENKPEVKPDFKKMSEDLAKSFKQNWIETKDIRATLLVDGLHFATGLVTVSDDHLVFCPNIPKQLDTPLREIASLKVNGIESPYLLEQTHALFDLSSDVSWYFNYTK
jgi:hypothetical protein